MTAKHEIGEGEKPLKVKKNKRSKAENGIAIADEVEVDVPVDAKSEKKKKHKRKRDAETEQDESLPASDSKKDKKKRKKDVSSESATQLAEPPEDASSSKKDKKDKKRRKKDTDSADVPPADADNDPVTSNTAIPSSHHEHPVTIVGGSVKPILSFDQLKIPSELHSALNGFKEPTAIQAYTWPPVLEGRDVVGIAETGSGKTLAFGIPAIARMLSSSLPEPKGPSAISVLVLAPTRELAIQTHDTLSALGAPFGIGSVALFGGVDKGGQIKALKRISKAKNKGSTTTTTTRIVVGTPGRILDLVNDKLCDLGGVQYLVLDEADRMLDKGFENDIRAIIGHTVHGPARQTLMFSATWPEAVRRLAGSFQREPVRVTIGSDDLTANSRVEQVVEVFDDAWSKDTRLLGHLRAIVPKKAKPGSVETRVLVFVLYKKEAVRVEGMLRSKGLSVAGLHGDMSQTARMDALQNFKTGAVGLLVATDVAARGLDIPNVAAVINYSFPLTIEDYIHRIGRTGRGGKSGKSITFFTGDNHERALAGELARVLRESGFEAEGLKKFPMTIKKKTHSAYGAFFRNDIPTPSGPTKITFD